MMDYKDLIGRLKYYCTTYAVGDNLGREIDGTDQVMADAATAIETLLEERDKAMEQLLDIQATLDMYGGEYGITAAFQKAAELDVAVEDLRGNCIVCSNKDCPPREKCAKCKYNKKWATCVGLKTSDFWEWRGPQKGDLT